MFFVYDLSDLIILDTMPHKVPESSGVMRKAGNESLPGLSLSRKRYLSARIGLVRKSA